MYRLFWITSIPDNNQPLIVTRSEDAVMELVMTDVLYLFIVKIKMAERMYFVALFFGLYIPES